MLTFFKNGETKFMKCLGNWSGIGREGREYFFWSLEIIYFLQNSTEISVEMSCVLIMEFII